MDYRDLNKASSKNDFTLPYIDFLVNNAIKMSRIHLWMDFLAIIRLEWQKKTKKRLFLSCLKEHFVIK